jgi:hypothetical protein
MKEQKKKEEEKKDRENKKRKLEDQDQKKADPKSNEPNYDRQLKWIIGVIVAIFLIIAIAVLIRNSNTGFKYGGLKFEQIKYGEIDLYSTNVPMYDGAGKRVKDLTVDFRLDPRELQDMRVLLGMDNEIKINTDELVYVSVDPRMEKCEDSGISVINLGGLFLKKAGVNTKISSRNESHAEKEAVPYVTCETHPNNTVIMFQPTKETGIYELDVNCYQFRYEDCEVLEVTERFQMLILEQYMKNLNGN